MPDGVLQETHGNLPKRNIGEISLEIFEKTTEGVSKRNIRRFSDQISGGISVGTLGQF